MNELSKESSRSATWGQWILSASGWLLMLCLFFAPLAFGGVEWWASIVITYGAWGVAILGMVGILTEGRMRGWLNIPIICWGVLLVQGWAMGWNAMSVYDAEAGAFIAIEKTWAWLPGTLDSGASYDEMMLLSGLAGVFIVARRLQEEVVWRKRLLKVMLFTGAVVISAGLIERLGVIDLWKNAHPAREGRSFGPYSYHANAGAYINIPMGLALGALIYVGRIKDGTRWGMIFSIWLTMMFVVGGVVTGSRGGMLSMLLIVITAGMAVLILMGKKGKVKSVKGIISRFGWRVAVGIVVGCVFGAVLLIGAGGDKAIERLKQLPPLGPRIETWNCSWPLVEQSGWMGHGPGAMKLLMPHVPTPGSMPIWHGITKPHVRGTRVSLWNHLHQDYLQTQIEWGFLGTSMWGVLLLGGMISGGRQIIAKRIGGGAFSQSYMIGIFLAMLGLCFHATFDFPMQVTSIRLYAVVMLAGLWGPAKPMYEKVRSEN